jgi:serine/threonine protein kinase
VDEELFELSYLRDKDGKTALDLILDRHASALGDDIPTFEYVHRLVSSDLPRDSDLTRPQQQQKLPHTTTLASSYFKTFFGQLNMSKKVSPGVDHRDQGSEYQHMSNSRCEQGYSWTLIVQRKEDFAVQIVERILTTYRDKSDILLFSTDLSGRRNLDIASTQCKLVLNRFRYLHGRYDVKSGPPEHISKTSLIKFAIDRLSPDATPVALKFMTHREQFLSEIMSRDMGGFSSEFVINVLKSYDGDSEDQGDVLFRHDAESKGFTLYPFCVVMEAADQNLKSFIDRQNICGKEWDVIRSITKQTATALEYIHSKGFVHGDIKPTNIMMTGQKLLLIDFDASASIDSYEYIGAKYSSAYIPPELLFCKEEEGDGAGVGESNRKRRQSRAILRRTGGNVMVRTFERPLSRQLEYSLLPAATSFDMWSLGAVLYLLCTGSVILIVSFVFFNKHGNKILFYFISCHYR